MAETTQLNYDDPMSLQKDGSDAYGYQFNSGHDLIGQEITKVEFLMKSYSPAPTYGVISVYVGPNQSGTAGNIIIGSINASTLSDSVTAWHTFTGTNTHVLAADDIIWIQYSTVSDQRAEVRYYGLGLTTTPINFWGNGGGLPYGNTLGSTSAGPTKSCFSLGSATIGVAPALDTGTYKRPTAIKVTDSDTPPPSSSGTRLPPPPLIARF